MSLPALSGILPYPIPEFTGFRRTRSVIYCGDEGRRLFKEGR